MATLSGFKIIAGIYELALDGKFEAIGSYRIPKLITTSQMFLIWVKTRLITISKIHIF